MAKEDIAPYQHNLALKREFSQLGLDLAEVMEFTPFDLDLENNRLEALLDFVRRFRKYGSQQAMELIENDFVFPPIFPGISPDSDWYRFNLWLQGKPVRKKLSEQLATTFTLKKVEELDDRELDKTLDQLTECLLNAGYGISLHEGVPPQLIYNFLVETLGETFELSPGGHWHLDGCTGYCPGCFQRMWCEVGDHSCWPEDEEAGKMSLIDELAPYVSASPQSLKILRKFQAEEDAQEEKFRRENPESSFGSAGFDDLWRAKLN